MCNKRQLSGESFKIFPSVPISNEVDVTISSRIESIGGLVTWANNQRVADA